MKEKKRQEKLELKKAERMSERGKELVRRSTWLLLLKKKINLFSAPG